MSLTPEDVRHVAVLARLGLTNAEIDLFAGQLQAVLGYVDKISELDITDVPPTAHAVEQVNVFREDVKKASLTQEQALANAPEQEEGAFLVPKII